MKKLTLFAVLLLTSVLAFSQTKRIAHRSHSGKDHTFNILSPDNFGLPVEKKKMPKTPSKEQAKEKKDSLKNIPPVKKDTILKTVPPGSTKHTITKEEVHILLAARKKFKSMGLL